MMPPEFYVTWAPHFLKNDMQMLVSKVNKWAHLKHLLNKEKKKDKKLRLWYSIFSFIVVPFVY